MNQSDKDENYGEDSPKTTKTVPKRLVIPSFLVVVLLILVIFIQKPQIIVQRAATDSQNSCSPIAYYCLILGGKRTCTQPKVCPTLVPTQGFVAQFNPKSKPASNPIPASGSAKTCTNPPAILANKLTIHFDFAQSTIRSTDQPTLNNLATALKNYPSATVTVAGNTDSVGAEVFNKNLSQERAQAAEDYLKKKGATSNKYTLVANGELKPVAPNTINGKDNPTGRALNRRDEITVDLGSSSCTSYSPKITCGSTGTFGWGGYSFSPPKNPNKMSISSQWNVVATTCNSKTPGFSVWPGIETNDKLIQAGSYALCPGNGGTTLRYVPWTMAYPGPFLDPPANDTIKPGDTMYTSITMNSPGGFTTVVKDITKGWSFTINTTDSGYKNLLNQDFMGAGQLLVEDEGGAQKQLAPFNPKAVSFSNSQFSVNGSTVAPLATAQGLTCSQIVRTGTILEQTSMITGDTFTQTWKHL